MSQFHANDVVIRDVKPENFLFAEEGETSHLKAIDFGIAQYCRCALITSSTRDLTFDFCVAQYCRCTPAASDRADGCATLRLPL